MKRGVQSFFVYSPKSQDFSNLNFGDVCSSKLLLTCKLPSSQNISLSNKRRESVNMKGR